jgi:aminoglycoside phosphotransferase (APT) family kinase protein
MVRAAVPDWTIVSVGRHGGPDGDGYPVTVTDGEVRRRLVCRVADREADVADRTEGYLLSAVGRRTAIPVPAVVAVADDHPDHPPFFLTERPGGARLDPGSLDAVARDRLARAAGRHLGQIHLVGSFRQFGRLRVRASGPDARSDSGRRLPPDHGSADRSGRGKGDSEGGPAGSAGAGEGAAGATGPGEGVPGDGGRERGPAGGSRPVPRAVQRGIEAPAFALGVADGHDDWSGRFGSLVAARAGRINGRFPALAADARAAVEATSLPDPDPVLCHGNYRYRSLRADPGTGEPTAVLEFGDAAVGAPRFDLVTAVDRLSRWAPQGSDRRLRVRECVLLGYETAAGRRPSLDGRGADAYRLASRLRALARIAERDGAEDATERFRERVRTVVDRLGDE